MTRGQWYFLRALWNTDGVSQRDLSARTGMMEPSTVFALRSMEKAGFIVRMRGEGDRRKMCVLLTAKAKRLRNELLGVARGITDEAESGIVARDLSCFRRVISAHDSKSRSDRAVTSPNRYASGARCLENRRPRGVSGLPVCEADRTGRPTERWRAAEMGLPGEKV